MFDIKPPVAVCAVLFAAGHSLAEEAPLSGIESLSFLEGRWQGETPDGSAFFEEYDMPDAQTLRSRRYADAAFTEAIDESRVSVEGGELVSRWGDFSWRASEITPGRACFEPIEAPSAFCWAEIGEGAVAVTQNWTDEYGAQQSLVIQMRRL